MNRRDFLKGLGLSASAAIGGLPIAAKAASVVEDSKNALHMQPETDFVHLERVDEQVLGVNPAEEAAGPAPDLGTPVETALEMSNNLRPLEFPSRGIIDWIPGRREIRGHMQFQYSPDDERITWLQQEFLQCKWLPMQVDYPNVACRRNFEIMIDDMDVEQSAPNVVYITVYFAVRNLVEEQIYAT